MNAQDTQNALAIKEARRAYYREWAKKNRDKLKANQNRYWLKRAERMRGGGQNDS